MPSFGGLRIAGACLKRCAAPFSARPTRNWQVRQRRGKSPPNIASANCRVSELIAADFAAVMARQGFEELAITVDDAVRAGALPGPLRDPFDRMLIAQALARNLILISNESPFDRYGIRRLW